MALQLRHEALAEAHHLSAALTLGVKVCTTLTATHGERGEGVFENLLEPEELEDTEVHRRVEADTALVRADSAVELHAIAAVDVNFAVVIRPRHAEDDGALGLGNALQNAIILVFLIRRKHRGDGRNHLLNSLQELRLIGVFGANLIQHSCSVICHMCGATGFRHSRKTTACSGSARGLYQKLLI